MAEIGSAYISLMASARDLPNQIQRQAGPGIDGFAKKSGLSFGKIFAAGAGLGLGAKAFSFLGDSLGEAKEAQQVGARTANVIKSMGLAGKVSADQIGFLSSKISKQTAVDDEAVQSAANLLLTFGNVASSAGKAGGVFNKTTGLAIDMSRALGTDANASALQLGKALNDPIKGVSALSRVGVSFTEQQKKTIKSLVDSGKLTKAQGVILGEVKKQFGGAGKALATPGEQAAVAFGNLKEQVGTSLLPVVSRLATFASSTLVPAISSFVTEMQTGVGTGGQVVDMVKQFGSNLQSLGGFLNSNRTLVASVVGAFVLYKATLTAVTVAQTVYTAVSKAAAFATKAFAIGQGVLNAVLTANPIGLVIAGIAALVAGFVIAYKKSDTFRGIVNAVGNALKSAAQAVLPLAKRVGEFVADLAARAFPAVKKFASFMVGIWSAEIRAGVAVVSAIISAVKNFVTNVIAGGKAVGDFARKVGEKIGAAIGFVKELPGKARAAVGDLGSLLLNAGRELINGLIRGIDEKIRVVRQKIASVAGIIKDHFPGSPVKTGPLTSWNNGGAGARLMDSLIDGISSREKALTAKLGKVTKKMRDNVASTIDGLKNDFSSLSDSVGSNLTGNLFSGFDTASSFLGNLTSVKGNLGSALTDFKTLKGFGLPAKFLAQLFADGGFPLIHELAADKTQATAAASLFGDIQGLSTQLGNSVAQADVGPKLDQQIALLKAIDAKLKDAPERTGATVGGQINNAAATGARNKKGRRPRR